MKSRRAVAVEASTHGMRGIALRERLAQKSISYSAAMEEKAS